MPILICEHIDALISRGQPLHSCTVQSSVLQPVLWHQIELKSYTFPVYCSGAVPTNATQVIVSFPSRTSTAERFVKLCRFFLPNEQENSFSIVALGAPEDPHFWFPKPAFDAPLELQQPYLEISLAAIEQLCQRLAEHVSIEDISLFGFSDSACLALEYMVRCGYPLNAVIALSGVLLGASLDASDRFNIASARTKVLLSIGGGISVALRVRHRQTEQVLKQCGYNVITFACERRPDTISPAELEMSRHVVYGTVAEG